MSKLSDNIRYLRSLKKFSQQDFATEIGISRVRYAKYEDGVSTPPLDILMSISRYYHISVDLLISQDLRKVDLDGLLELEGNRILLPMKADRSGGNTENFIEIIPHSAKAGYQTGYSDPEFIEALQHISLPFLKKGKYRAFPVEGDSMPPHREGSFIVAKFVESLEQVKLGKTYVILTRNEGIVYKRVFSGSKKTFTLVSDNTFYKPYPVKHADILELWEYSCSIATTEFEPDDLSHESIRDMFHDLKRQIAGIRENVGKG